MKARVNFNVSLSEPISIGNGVRQGDIPGLTLFSIYFALTLAYAFRDCDIGVYLRLRRSLQTLIRELLYADGADLVVHAEGNGHLTTVFGQH